MMLGGVFFLALIILAVVWLARDYSGGPERGFERHSSATTTESPVDILDRRLAAGELSEEEYRHRRKMLERDTRSPT